jgi:hypothetical protein
MNEALKQLEALLSQTATAAPRFPPNSRYHTTPTAVLVTAGARVITYLRRRFVPAPERFATLREHLVAQGDRLDRVAAQHLGDPELFYRICDANGAVRPDELVEVAGTRLRITLPEGVPGASDG